MRWSAHRPTPFVLAIAISLSACAEPPPPPPGQEILAEIEAGTPRADVMDRLPPGELAEGETPRQLRGYRLERYFVEGATVEVVWLHRQGSGGEVEEPRTDLTPVIFREGVLEGYGWAHFDERAGAWSLASPGEPGGAP